MSTLKVNKIRDTAGSADAIVLDPSGGAKIAGVCTATTFDGAATSLTQIPAANLVGVCTSGLTKTGGFGNLVNYSHTLKTDTFSESVGQGAVTGDAISVSHTASSTNNKLLISYSIHCGSNYSGTMNIFSYLYIGGSVSAAIGDASGNLQRATASAFSNFTHPLNQSFQTIIQAASTNATTYSVRLAHTNNSTNTIYLNRGGDGTDVNYMGRPCSSIQVLEFAPNT